MTSYKDFRCDILNRLILLLALAASPCSPVFAEDAGDLKGHSIQVNWTTVTTFRRQGVIKTTVPEKREWRGYIGAENHIFEKSDFANSSRHEHFGGASVSEFGKARQSGRGTMSASTIIDGKLTIITSLVRGSNVLSISISSSRDSCSFSAKLMPDEAGKIQIIDPYTELPTELLSRTVQSYTCMIKQGNIFAE